MLENKLKGITTKRIILVDKEKEMATAIDKSKVKYIRENIVQYGNEIYYKLNEHLYVKEKPFPMNTGESYKCKKKQ